jgi:hypothetical protein
MTIRKIEIRNNAPVSMEAKSACHTHGLSTKCSAASYYQLQQYLEFIRYIMEISNGKPCQNLVLRREAE